MPKYHVTNVSVMRITSTYEVVADSAEEAEDKVDHHLGTLIGTYEKFVDGDSSVTEYKGAD